MRRQRNMSHMKEQDKTPEKERNKIETIKMDTNTGYKDAH